MSKEEEKNKSTKRSHDPPHRAGSTSQSDFILCGYILKSHDIFTIFWIKFSLATKKVLHYIHIIEMRQYSHEYSDNWRKDIQIDY